MNERNFRRLGCKEQQTSDGYEHYIPKKKERREETKHQRDSAGDQDNALKATCWARLSHDRPLRFKPAPGGVYG